MRLHRSLGFWLGLLPAIFLIWVWVDSRAHLNSWWRALGSAPVHTEWVGISKSEIYLTQKEIVLQEGPKGSSHFEDTPEWGRFERKPIHEFSSDLGPWFPAPRSMRASVPFGSAGFNAGSLDTRGIAVPFWLLLAVYGVFWIGLLVWWRRRKRRLANPEALPSHS